MSMCQQMLGPVNDDGADTKVKHFISNNEQIIVEGKAVQIAT